MNRFAICDDDNDFAKLCINMLQNIFDNECECVYYDSYETAVANCQNDGVEVYLVDIEYGSESGYDLARSLQKIKGDIGIVYVTNHNEYVTKSFVARPLGFVRKGNLEEDLLEYKDGILEFIAKNNREIALRDGKSEIMVALNSLIYIYMNGHYMDVVCKERTLEIRDKISRIEYELAMNSFIKINRSCMVNAKYIEKINGVEVRLVNSKILYASEDRKRQIMLGWQRYVVKG